MAHLYFHFRWSERASAVHSASRLGLCSLDDVLHPVVMNAVNLPAPSRSSATGIHSSIAAGVSCRPSALSSSVRCRRDSFITECLHTDSNPQREQGRINHCTGCTMGGPPPPTPSWWTAKFLPRWFDVVWTFSVRLNVTTTTKKVVNFSGEKVHPQEKILATGMRKGPRLALVWGPSNG